jgi:hypothetical protein
MIKPCTHPSTTPSAHPNRTPNLHLQPKRQDSLRILHNLIPSQLTLPIHPIDKTNRHLRNRTPHCLRPHHHLHLERVALTLRTEHDLLQHLLLIQPKTAREIAHAGPQNRIGKQIRAPADELPLQIPTVHAAIARVPRARDDVVASVRRQLLLLRDHPRDELRVVREVGVHDDDEGARGELQAVDIGRPKAELASAGLEEDVGGVGFCELVGDDLRSVGGAVVDDYEFPVEVSVNEQLVRRFRGGGWRGHVQLGEGAEVMMGRLRRSL